jgi:hypothetical protein
MENEGIFMSIQSILRPFAKVCVRLVYFRVIWHIFPRFGMLYIPRKIWQPCAAQEIVRFETMALLFVGLAPGANPTIVSYNASVVKIHVSAVKIITQRVASCVLKKSFLLLRKKCSR